MLHAAPLGVVNREEHARVVGFLDDASSGSYRQTALLLNLVYHFHRLVPPSIRYPLHSRRLHCASLAIRQLAHSLPSKPTPAGHPPLRSSVPRRQSLAWNTAGHLGYRAGRVPYPPTYSRAVTTPCGAQ